MERDADDARGWWWRGPEQRVRTSVPGNPQRMSGDGDNDGDDVNARTYPYRVIRNE